MRRFVNLYIVLFLIDAGVSLLDAAIYYFGGVRPLSPIQGLIAFAVVLFSIPLYVMVSCMKGFPKRVVLPLVLLTLWMGLLGGLPIPIFLGIHKTMLVLSLVQVCLGMAMLVTLRYTHKDKRWLYTDSEFESLMFRWPRFGAFVIAHVMIIIPLIGLSLAGCLSLAVSHKSHGFLHLDWKGVSAETRTYLCEGKKIFLVPTAHIAKPGFYHKSMKTLPVADTVVIPEGVTDEHQLLKDGLDYKKLARSMRLEAQNNQTLVAQRSTKCCDVDVNDFSPETIEFLRACTGLIRAWSSGDKVAAIKTWSTLQEPDLQMLDQDLLENRNQRVIDCASECLEAYENVIIPWGGRPHARD